MSVRRFRLSPMVASGLPEVATKVSTSVDELPTGTVPFSCEPLSPIAAAHVSAVL